MAKRATATVKKDERIKLKGSDDLVKDLMKFMGQKVAVICARYQYRGVLSSVSDRHIVLANATSVEISGASNTEAPQTEDQIGSSIIIMLDAIELFYQPNWVFHALPGDDA